MCEKGEHGRGVITEKHSSIGQRKQLESDSQATQLLLYRGPGLGAAYIIDGALRSS